jgi:hypothetical protein
MKYRLELENGNNSEQLLEVINQGICNSLERQLDDAHAPTIAGYLNPRPVKGGRAALGRATPHFIVILSRLPVARHPIRLNECLLII